MANPSLIKITIAATLSLVAAATSTFAHAPAADQTTQRLLNPSVFGSFEPINRDLTHLSLFTPFPYLFPDPASRQLFLADCSHLSENDDDKAAVAGQAVAA